MIKDELREKCRKVMMDHLETVGPNINLDIELPAMWRKLEGAGLTDQLDYRAYLWHAMRQYEKAIMMTMMGQ